jgi:hypothetical protein
MTTAPQENRGGYRPKAAQNNQVNVKPMGGNGQSGRMNLDYSGLPYGQNKAINEQRTAAPTKAPSFNVGSFRMADARSMQQVTPVTAESMLPNQSVTDMSGLASLPQPAADPDIEQIRIVMPVLEYWASQPDSSQGTKDYVQYLRTII